MQHERVGEKVKMASYVENKGEGDWSITANEWRPGSESPTQGTARRGTKRYVGSPRRFGGIGNASRGSYYQPDTPNAPQGKRRQEEPRRFYPSCLTGEAPEIRHAAVRKTVERETDMHKVQQRQKQVDYGKNTLGYERYCQQVKKSERRQREHPNTPDATVKMSNRRFNGLVRAWRRTLHMFDPEGTSEGGAGPSPAASTPVCATPASVARTDCSAATSTGGSDVFGSRGGKVIFSPGDDDEEEKDFMFLQEDLSVPMGEGDKVTTRAREGGVHESGGVKTDGEEGQDDDADEEGDDEGEDDKSVILFMEVDDPTAREQKPLVDYDESDDDML